MSFTISITGQDISFDCAADETLLDAAERAGYAMPYSCRKGVCLSCEGTLVSGEAMVRGRGLRTGPAEAVLFCQTRPRTDLKIAPARIQKAEPALRKRFEAKVRNIAQPVPGVAVLHLRLPIGKRSVFRAGQYLRVLFADGDSRNFSMANPPHRNDELELHIRHVQGGRFSEGVLATLQKGSRLHVEMPYGQFGLSNNVCAPAILIATGTGFAPIKSIIEHQIHSGGARQIRLYWGGNSEADLYMRELPEKWASRFPWFEFVPVVMKPSRTWKGRTGFVHLAVQEDHPDMSGLEVYACGAPLMIDAAQRGFTASFRRSTDAFFSDAFVPSGDAETRAELSLVPAE